MQKYSGDITFRNLIILHVLAVLIKPFYILLIIFCEHFRHFFPYFNVNQASLNLFFYLTTIVVVMSFIGIKIFIYMWSEDVKSSKNSPKNRYLIILAISWMFLEVSAVCGFIFWFVGGDIQKSYILIILSAITTFLVYPSKKIYKKL